MAQAGPRTQGEPAARRGGDLAARLASGVVMAAAALAVAWIGGTAFSLFWAGAAAIVLWEWVRLTRGARPAALWLAAGIVYAVATFAGPALLRADGEAGFPAIVFLFAVVWSTDVVSYITGRRVGGARLWPAVSPNKTWAGALGGIAGAVAAGFAVAEVAGLRHGPVIALAALLSVASQSGDLLESAIKRRFGVKDASHVIPGHGGVMDRLDGFIVAAALAAIIGVARGGLMRAGHGLLAW